MVARKNCGVKLQHPISFYQIFASVTKKAYMRKPPVAFRMTPPGVEILFAFQVFIIRHALVDEFGWCDFDDPVCDGLNELVIVRYKQDGAIEAD